MQTIRSEVPLVQYVIIGKRQRWKFIFRKNLILLELGIEPRSQACEAYVLTARRFELLIYILWLIASYILQICQSFIFKNDKNYEAFAKEFKVLFKYQQDLQQVYPTILQNNLLLAQTTL